MSAVNLNTTTQSLAQWFSCAEDGQLTVEFISAPPPKLPALHNRWMRKALKNAPQSFVFVPFVLSPTKTCPQRWCPPMPLAGTTWRWCPCACR